jgi:hypothetical protein
LRARLRDFVPGDPVDLVLVLVDVLVGGCGDPGVEQKSQIWVLGAHVPDDQFEDIVNASKGVDRGSDA